MEPFEDLVVNEKKQISGNIWGWKWSWISLAIIIAGYLFLIFIGPKDGPVQIFEQDQEDSTEVVIDPVNE
ncbi:MAG: hypothetical protein GY751_22335 [Bacteroidetes bacterium]|nr:hypothetical protein [Bacteroidota bacterium]